jgi:hypothetical protein
MSDGVKLALKIFVTVIILVVLLVGGLIGYTWWVGKNAPKVESAVDIANKLPKQVKREARKQAPDAPVGVSVQSITAAAPGGNASVTIRALERAKCSIVVDYNGTVSKDSGLAPKDADEWGMVTWSWTVEPTVPEGKYPVKMTCVRNKQSGFVQADLEVKK